MSNRFNLWVSAIQSDIENALATYLPTTSDRRGQIELNEAMRYAVLGGGKRIRPLLVFATGYLFNAPKEVLLPVACAVEMIHAYSLVHDDMPCMDNDTLRRGKPTTHIQFGEAMALLTGDALQAQAFAILAKTGDDPTLSVERIGILAVAAGASGMCGGQAIDLTSIGFPLSYKELEQMDQLKTGALIKASVVLGALSGQKRPSPKAFDALSAYAHSIGLAFQIIDDILDVTGDTDGLGKTAGKDIRDDKPTYVSLLGLQESRKLTEKLHKQAYDALEQFGSDAELLREIADLIIYRKK